MILKNTQMFLSGRISLREMPLKPHELPFTLQRLSLGA